MYKPAAELGQGNSSVGDRECHLLCGRVGGASEEKNKADEEIKSKVPEKKLQVLLIRFFFLSHDCCCSLEEVPYPDPTPPFVSFLSGGGRGGRGGF